MKTDRISLKAANHKDIIEACKRGNRHAQFELYKLYSKAMYNICLRMVKDSHDAEDLLQNSFVDVFTHLETFRYQSSFGAWMKRIVINNCINFIKKRKIRFEEMKDNYVERAEEKENKTPLSVDAVNKAMFKLPDGYRIVFSLYMLEGYDHAEISQILGISESTSKSQYHRAKQKLKEILITNSLATN